MPARIGHPNATWGITEGNPIHDDVREIARMVTVHFAIDVTLNREQKITAAFAGEILAEHRRACAYAKDTAMREVPSPFDVVLTTNSGYPLDQNLYQAVKGMSAAAKIVKPGGTIVCAAECRDGLPNHGSYGAVLASAPTSSRAARDDQRARVRGPRPVAGPGPGADSDQGECPREDSRGSDPDEIRAAHFTPIDDVVARPCTRPWIAPVRASTLCVLPQGPQTIPYLASEA